MLLENGHAVIALDDLSTGSLRNVQHLIGRRGFQLERGSVLDRERCHQAIAEADVVVHLAAAVGVKLVVEQPIETIDRNVRGTEHVLEGALRYGRKVFLASTSEVYGKETRPGTSVFRETDDVTLGVSMRWSYACSKALDEFLGLAYYNEHGLPVVIGRMFNTVGPRQTGRYGMVVPNFVRQALAGEPITVFGPGDQQRCFCHVGDVVRALADLPRRPDVYGEVFNLGSTEEVSINELARRIKTMTGSSSEIVHVPYDEAYAEGFEDMRRRVPDLTKVKAALDWEPTASLETILSDVIAYERQTALDDD
jgi:UDP-glucose 4-epimerase